MKLMLDADAAIKLWRAGVLETLTENCVICVTKTVLAEIARGKDLGHDDAYAIEKMAADEKITTIEANPVTAPSLGKGERSILGAIPGGKITAVISDDRRFLNMLGQINAPFITSSDTIVLLLRMQRISKLDAQNALNLLRPMIRDKSYIRSNEDIRQWK